MDLPGEIDGRTSSAVAVVDAGRGNDKGARCCEVEVVVVEVEVLVDILLKFLLIPFSRALGDNRVKNMGVVVALARALGIDDILVVLGLDYI
jgi:hypothetical protein